MKKFYFLIMPLFVFIACEKYDEDVVQITGLYHANVLGISGPHTISIAYDRGDEIVIEAPFDGFEWIYINADVDHQRDFIKEIDIYEQQIGPGVFIWGEGFYQEGTIQLDYTIEFSPFEIYDFRIVGVQH